MMRAALLLAALPLAALTLSACGGEEPASAPVAGPETACEPDAYRHLLNRRLEDIKPIEMPVRYRIAPEGAVLALDYVANRVTIFHDPKRGVVSRLRCG